MGDMGLHHRTPEVRTELTHEIYWGTPGVPCDVAALKHADLYHIPLNKCLGSGPGGRYDPEWDVSPDKLRRRLLRACFNARKRYYAHRGLPLRGLEYWAAATVNHRGSLSPRVQDRQVCSWLMGAPMVFSGDLSSLTEENIAHYRKRFRLLDRLQEEYGIYRHFQYSGVPDPTDKKWHWWGKLNDRGHGAVVVLRGSEGQGRRSINIPWVDPGKSYRVTACFKGQELGVFTGRQLRNGKVTLSLPRYGQDILEVAAP